MAKAWNSCHASWTRAAVMILRSLYFSRFLSNRPPPRQLFWHSCKMAARNAKRSISTILREDRGLWTVYYAIPIRENMKLIILQSWAYFFFTRSRLTIHINLQASSPFGEVARSHSRAAQEGWRELRRSLSSFLAACFARHSKRRACSKANSWDFLRTS